MLRRTRAPERSGGTSPRAGTTSRSPQTTRRRAVYPRLSGYMLDCPGSGLAVEPGGDGGRPALDVRPPDPRSVLIRLMRMLRTKRSRALLAAAALVSSGALVGVTHPRGPSPHRSRSPSTPVPGWPPCPPPASASITRSGTPLSPPRDDRPAPGGRRADGPLPGGSYGDIYHWQDHTASGGLPRNSGGVKAPRAGSPLR